ncbi:hypothetical protein MLD38_000536 [Melastoma candidum]|uniref:Uncharacterized protein n=1 Tax=Melastoma candidum TaxID=119954 RepID=A0ACB9SA64_9MYRT|nr:hypothetical protein MLD38_000536 [Melastoma candidum]
MPLGNSCGMKELYFCREIAYSFFKPNQSTNAASESKNFSPLPAPKILSQFLSLFLFSYPQIRFWEQFWVSLNSARGIVV